MKTNKRRLKNRLFCLVLASFCLPSAVWAAPDLDRDNQSLEASLSADLQRAKNAAEKASVLVQLALVRERLGKLREALATWDSLKKQYGMIKPEQFATSAPPQSGAQLALFFSERVKRKQKQKTPRLLDRAARQRIAQGIMRWKEQPPVEQLDLSVQADLDGDGIDELFFIGSNGPLGKRKKDTMGIARWNGQSYVTLWKSRRRIPFMVHVVDYDGDGWKEIFCGYTPDSDDAATLYFNGQRALFY